MANELENPNTETKTEAKSEQKTNDTASLEARIKALETENGKLKQSVTNASADASEWKKKYQSQLSDEQKAKEDRDAATAAMQKELEDLRTERNLAKYTAALVGQDIGMDAETAKVVAEALNAGETDKVFDGIRKFVASHDKALAEKAMLNNPTLPGGKTEKTVTREEFDKMGYREMLALKNEHPDLYNEFMNKT